MRIKDIGIQLLDLLLILLFVDLSMIFVLVPPYNSFLFARVIFALLLLLFLPGYSLMCILFPRRNELSGIERLTLSIVVSVAITVFDGFAINFSPWHYRPASIILSLSLITAIFVFFALISRFSVPKRERYYFDFSVFSEIVDALKDRRPFNDIEKALIISFIGSLIIAVGLFAYAEINFPREKFTVLYVLSPEGKAYNYPDLYLLEATPFTVGIENYEHSRVNYTLIVALCNHTLHEINISLNHNEKWIKKIEVVPKHVGKHIKLEFRLYRENNPKVYRHVFIYVNSSVNYKDVKNLRKYMLQKLPSIKNSDMEQNTDWVFKTNVKYFRGYFTKFHVIRENSRIRGYVVDNSTGLPIPKAKILIEDHYDYRKSIKADENGYYEVNTIAGHLWVYAGKKGYKANITEIDIKEGEVIFLNITLEQAPIVPKPKRLFNVSGYVVDEITGKPIPNAIIKITNKYGLSYYAKTNESGFYRVEYIPGNAYMKVTANGYAPRRIVKIEQLRTLNITLTPLTAVLKGYIYDKISGNPISDAVVSVYVDDFRNTTRTNKSGYFEIRSLPGVVKLEITKGNYYKYVTKFAIKGEKNITVKLKPVKYYAIIKGFVEFHGKGVPNVEVVAYGEEKKSTMTDRRGYFEFYVRPGTYLLYVVPRVYIDQDIVVEAKERQVINVKIELNALPNSTFKMIFPLGETLRKGNYAEISQKLTSKEGLAVLSFKVKDSYTGELEGRVFKQVLINNRIVWEEDVAKTGDWKEVKIPITFDNGTNILKLRVYAKQNFPGPLTVWWDDVKVISFSELLKDKTTRFEVLNSSTGIPYYPIRIYLGVPETVVVKVENHEYKTVDYKLQIKLNGDILKEESFTLNHGEVWEKSITFIPNKIGSQLLLEFLLFKNTKLYKSLRFFVSSEIDYSRLEAAKKFEISPIPEIINGNLEKLWGWKVEKVGNFTGKLSTNAAIGMYSYSMVQTNLTKQGDFIEISQFVKTEMSGVVVLSFNVTDNYYKPGVIGLCKQVLVNDLVVWEEDVAGAEDWKEVKIPVYLKKGYNKIALRVYAKKNVDYHDIRVYWDKVEFKPLGT